jgi:hypothetical protein
VRDPEGRVLFDEKQNISGRGAYVCSGGSCMEKAQKGNLISRILGVIPAKPSTQLDHPLIKKGMERVRTMLGFAVRSRQAVLGTLAVREGIKKQRVRVVLLDFRTGNSTRNKVEAQAARGGVPVIRLPADVSLERWVGKRDCRVIGVTGGRFAKTIMESLPGTMNKSMPVHESGKGRNIPSEETE